MLKAISTYAFVRERLHPGLLDGLVRSGAEAIEIFAFRGHFDYANRKQHVLEIASWFKSTGIALNSVHAPMFSDYEWGKGGNPPLNIASPDRAARVEAMDEIKRAIEIAEMAPFRYLIQHIGVSGEEFDMRKVDAAFSSLEQISLFARQRDVEVLLENIPNDLSSAERLLQFEELTHIGLNYVFDTGHAHMKEGVEAAYQLLKERIRSTHIHDNDGTNDIHLFPFLTTGGTIDWKNAMSNLRSRENQYPLLLELRERPEITNPLEAVEQVFTKLEEQ